jgi:hypothetical protein
MKGDAKLMVRHEGMEAGGWRQAEAWERECIMGVMVVKLNVMFFV